MKIKFFIFVALIATLFSCTPDDLSGQVPSRTAYANEQYEGTNTEYCRFDSSQDDFFPYMTIIPAGPGNQIKVIADSLNVQFNRRGTRAVVTGEAFINNQSEQKKFNIRIVLRNIQDPATLVLFSPEICVGDVSDLLISPTVRGRFTSQTDSEVYRIQDGSIAYVGEKAAYKNGEYVRGIILQLEINGIRSYGQIVLQ